MLMYAINIKLKIPETSVTTYITERPVARAKNLVRQEECKSQLHTLGLRRTKARRRRKKFVGFKIAVCDSTDNLTAV
jgi:hypothetical protein